MQMGTRFRSLGKKDEEDDGELPHPEKLPPPRMPSMKVPETKRIDKYLTIVMNKTDSYNPQLAGCVGAVKPLIIAVIQGILFLAPWYKYAALKVYEVTSVLPHDVIQMVFGAALCFFGGTYVASIAAIEAFRQLGWQKVYKEVEYIQEQLVAVAAANDEDDARDDDGDGVADVDQIEAAELAHRKLALVMKVVEQPHRLQEAVGALFTAYLAVLATLRLEFARTTAFALGIVEMAKFPIIRTLSPMVCAALGEDLAHWTQTLIESTLTFFAVIFAWYLQMIVSAFYSGLRGGRIFADALIAFLDSKGLMEKIPFIPQPFDASESYLDEAVGYSLAAIGFLFQFFNGFALPFPLNLIFLPLTIVEWFLRFQISMEGAKPLV